MTIDDCHQEIVAALTAAHGEAVELPCRVMRFSVNPRPTTEPPLDAVGKDLDLSDCWVEVSRSPEDGIVVLGQNYCLAAGMTVGPNGWWYFYPPKECGYSGPTYVQLAELDPATIRNALKIFQ